MDRINNRIAHIYGYAVCLTAVVVMFFAIRQIIDASINLTDPLRADQGGYSRMGFPLTNFELFKVEAQHRPMYPVYMAPGAPPPALNPADTTEAVLRRRFDAERVATIESAHFRAIRSLVANFFLIAFAVIVFGVHWRWLKRQDAEPLTP